MPADSRYRLGVDVGGTFTDLVFADTEAGQTGVHKISTTPDDPSRGVVAGLTALCEKYKVPRETIDVVFHGTTIATNAILEHDGAVTGIGNTFTGLGGRFRSMQNGFTRSYALTMVVGAVIISAVAVLVRLS